MNNKYTFNFIKISGFDNDFGVINRWLSSKGEGEYILTVEKFTGEKKNGRIEVIKKEDE